MGLEKFPVIPVAIGAGVAALNGFVASTDVNAGRTKITSQRSLWVKGGAIVAGVGLELMGQPMDVVDPFIIMGTGLLVDELAFKIAQNGKGSSAVPPQGYQRQVMPAPAPEAVAAHRVAAHDVPQDQQAQGQQIAMPGRFG